MIINGFHKIKEVKHPSVKVVSTWADRINDTYTAYVKDFESDRYYYVELNTDSFKVRINDKLHNGRVSNRFTGGLSESDFESPKCLLDAINEMLGSYLFTKG